MPNPDPFDTSKYPHGKVAGANKFGFKSCPTCGKPATHPTKEEYPWPNSQIPADGFFMFRDELVQGNIISLACVRLVKMEYLAMNDRIPGTTYDNPIWYRDKWRIYVSWSNFVNYEYVHDDYDGAEDSHDNRCGYGESIEACKAEIDERFYE